MTPRRQDDTRAVPEGYPHGPAAAVASVAALDALADPRSIVLVEGVSDQIAVNTAAARLGVSGLPVVPVGGAHGLRWMLRAVAQRHPDALVSGVYDTAEEHVVRAALETSGEPESAGFFACRADLEDELIRACGVDLALACLESEGERGAFEKLQRQPEWRERPVEQQLRRWISSGARRKLRYAAILVDAVPIERMPRPLVRVITRARQA